MEVTASVIYRTIQWQVAHISPQILAAVCQTEKNRNHLYNSFFLYKQSPHVINYMRYSNLLDHNGAV